MFEQLIVKNFTVGMNNFFISAKFYLVTITELEQKVMIHGVCKTHDKGLPKPVI